MTVKSLKVREVLSKGMTESLKEKNQDEMPVRNEVLQTICNLNKIKRRLADTELDYDLAIKTIEKVDEVKIQEFTFNEIKAITYSILFLL